MDEREWAKFGTTLRMIFIYQGARGFQKLTSMDISLEEINTFNI